MIYIPIENTTMPVLGFGTYKLQGKTCSESVADAIAIGYRHIDTAETYENEKEVGNGIKSSGIDRGQLFLTTKVWYTHLKHDALIKAVESSLRKLQTDYVDLLLIHWPSKEVHMEEPLEAMMELKRQGKIKLLGVSNFTCDMVDKAIALAPVVCNQVEYHPFLDQGQMLDTLRDNDMVLTAYSPIAKGKVFENVTLKEIGKKYNKTPAQVTLRWHTQQDKVAAIPKSSDAERRQQNFDIFDFELTPEEMQQISALRGDGRMINPKWAPEWDC